MPITSGSWPTRVELALDGLHDAPLDRAREAIIQAVVVNAHGARSVVRVGAIDEDVRRRDASRLVNLRDNRVERCAGHHQDITRNNGEPNAVPFDHSSDATQLPLLTRRFARSDAPGDGHRVISRQFNRGDADEKFTGFPLRECRDSKCQE